MFPLSPSYRKILSYAAPKGDAGQGEEPRKSWWPVSQRKHVFGQEIPLSFFWEQISQEEEPSATQNEHSCYGPLQSRLGEPSNNATLSSISVRPFLLRNKFVSHKNTIPEKKLQ